MFLTFFVGGGDNEYTLPPTFIISYSGQDKQNSVEDVFNFLLSQ
jgi:hypothetical protein